MVLRSNDRQGALVRPKHCPDLFFISRSVLTCRSSRQGLLREVYLTVSPVKHVGAESASTELYWVGRGVCVLSNAQWISF